MFELVLGQPATGADPSDPLATDGTDASATDGDPADDAGVRAFRHLDRNLLNLLVAAEATQDERAEFERRYRERVEDWRPVLSGPQPATDRLSRPDFGASPILA